jgi:hypothetical protein
LRGVFDFWIGGVSGIAFHCIRLPASRSTCTSLYGAPDGWLAFRPYGDLPPFQQQQARRQRLILQERINAIARRVGRKDAPNNTPPLLVCRCPKGFPSVTRYSGLLGIGGNEKTRGEKPPLKQLFVLIRQYLRCSTH